MSSIVQEKVITFKEFEKKIFNTICEIGRKFTTEALTRYDQKLSDKRDVKVCRDKGKRKTSIKTVYGSVEYSRRVYQRINAESICTITFAFCMIIRYNYAIRQFKLQKEGNVNARVQLSSATR